MAVLMDALATHIAANDVDAADARNALPATPGFLRAGNPRPVLRATLAAIREASDGVLAVVLETEGSTYADPGTMALFTSNDQTGWLSGGCLEPELARRAMEADVEGRIGWIEIDTRDDASMFSGSAVGCRGRLRIALLPLHLLSGLEHVIEAWLAGGTVIERRIHTDGSLMFAAGGQRKRWQLAVVHLPWPALATHWTLPLPRLPEILMSGAGPETPSLLRLLGELGWRSTLCERRSRWQGVGTHADSVCDTSPVQALHSGAAFDAVLVMHHNFELDRDALEAAAHAGVGFIGLLGPPRRRDDLLGLLPPMLRAALLPRLRAPVGIDLGGKGPEAIALSIAAQLQGWRSEAGTS